MPTPEEILQQYWGYDGFRPMQRDIIVSVVNGSDTLALLPTGGGKSLCYQVPALMMEGVCLVVSPLIALMQDQVQRLKTLGVAAECIYSGMNYRQVKAILEGTRDGDYKLLYISPERLQTAMFREYMYHFDLSLVAVDEAHCVSQWGHDFRPDYLKISELRKLFTKAPFLALTATATRDIEADVCNQLRLVQPAIFRQSFARNNIFFRVSYSENKQADTLYMLGDACSIVYCRSRKQTEMIGNSLQQQGLEAAVYHAGLVKEKRTKAQERWMNNEAPVMVATTAFGMGIDKPDVRTVVHYDAPEHLEAWYQEAGRAGRDGLKSLAVTFYNSTDIRRLEESTELLFPPEAYLRRVYQSVAEYLQIPTGTEPHRYYPFDLIEFAKRFSLAPNQAIHALKLLEREGLWTLTEAVYSPSTVQFITDRHVLDQLASVHPTLRYISVGLLRLFNSIFFYPTPVREAAVARQLKVKQAELVQALETLHKMEIIEYNKTGEGPQLFFHHGRVDSQHLVLDLNRIHTLRKRHEVRTEAMIGFLNNDSTCRERYVLQYFGEKADRDCGHCDICFGKRQIKRTSEARRTSILVSICEGKDTLVMLTADMSTVEKDAVINLLRKMVDAGELAFDGQRFNTV